MSAFEIQRQIDEMHHNKRHKTVQNFKFEWIKHIQQSASVDVHLFDSVAKIAGPRDQQRHQCQKRNDLWRQKEIFGR